MAHFAKLGLNGRIIDVVHVNNETILDADGNESETLGVQFLTNLTNWAIWKQTSYNTFANEHKSGGTPFRKNFASIGGIYDEDRDAFINKKPFDSAILNQTTCRWEAPIPHPDPDNDSKTYSYNVETESWEVIGTRD